MTVLTHCEITSRNSLGKGEVESSILSGSTTNHHEMSTARNPCRPHSAVASRTYPEDGNSVRGVSVDSVHGACLALIAWAKGKPADIRDLVADVCRALPSAPESPGVRRRIADQLEEIAALSRS
jgi:hypothetical protein